MKRVIHHLANLVLLMAPLIGFVLTEKALHMNFVDRAFVQLPVGWGAANPELAVLGAFFTIPVASAAFAFRNSRSAINGDSGNRWLFVKLFSLSLIFQLVVTTFAFPAGHH